MPKRQRYGDRVITGKHRLPSEQRFQLFFGPYEPPRVRNGQPIFCEIRGWVTVQGFSDGRIPWPRGTFPGYRGNGPLVICGDLLRAIRQESRYAIQHEWGVGTNTISHWRKALGVPEHNKGTLKLWSLWRPLKLHLGTIPISRERLRARRLALGLTLRDVARRCGWGCRNSYQQLEAGRRRTTHIKTLRKLATVLKCRVADLVDGRE